MNVLPDDMEFHLPVPGEDDRPGIEDAVDADDLVDDDDDYPEDATEDDVDIAVALYREDGQPTAIPLELDLVNDLDALIDFLRRLPGDAGSLGVMSLAGEMFALVRVRGRNEQVYLSDILTVDEWPIARDIVDYLGEDDPDDDDDSAPVGDSSILADAGLRDIELDAIASNYEEDTTVLLERIATKIQYGPQFREALADADE